MKEDRIARLVRETRELIIAKDWIESRRARTLRMAVYWPVDHANESHKIIKTWRDYIFVQ